MYDIKHWNFLIFLNEEFWKEIKNKKISIKDIFYIPVSWYKFMSTAGSDI